jgi:hypothetical protein
MTGLAKTYFQTLSHLGTIFVEVIENKLCVVNPSAAVFFVLRLFFTAKPVCTLRGGNVAPRAASVSAC